MKTEITYHIKFLAVSNGTPVLYLLFFGGGGEGVFFGGKWEFFPKITKISKSIPH